MAKKILEIIINVITVSEVGLNCWFHTTPLMGQQLLDAKSKNCFCRPILFVESMAQLHYLVQIRSRNAALTFVWFCWLKSVQPEWVRKLAFFILQRNLLPLSLFIQNVGWLGLSMITKLLFVPKARSRSRGHAKKGLRNVKGLSQT